MFTDSSSWSTVEAFLEKNDSQTSYWFHETQWDELCRHAADLAGQSQCVALDRVTCGLNNITRVLEFPNKTCWIARIHIRRSSSPFNSSASLKSEIATMQFIKEQSDLPVPRVFGYDTNEENPVGSAYILMEFLPGIAAMDALGGYKVHRGVIARGRRQNFYRSVAKCHVRPLTHLRDLSNC
ncbi:hypothetical protein VI817_009332 [Penicillium citrinum]|nr:hypothetical protein VI817_009332 [Penicillium citrinum]